MKSTKLFFLIAFLISTFVFASSKQKILTTAEKTNYESTSRYSDVMGFFKQLKKNSPNNIRIETLAKSIEGRDVPLIIMGNPLPKSPKNLIKDKRITIYVQANIHEGEVEGNRTTRGG